MYCNVYMLHKIIFSSKLNLFWATTHFLYYNKLDICGGVRQLVTFMHGYLMSSPIATKFYFGAEIRVT